MTHSPDFLDVVILQSMCLANDVHDPFKLTFHHGSGTVGEVDVTWSTTVAERVSEWVDSDEWVEIACTPLAWEVSDAWGVEWLPEAEVGTEAVVASRAGRVLELLGELTWTVPDVPPALIVCQEIDLVQMCQVTA